MHKPPRPVPPSDDEEERGGKMRKCGFSSSSVLSVAQTPLLRCHAGVTTASPSPPPQIRGTTLLFPRKATIFSHFPRAVEPTEGNYFPLSLFWLLRSNSDAVKKASSVGVSLLFLSRPSEIVDFFAFSLDRRAKRRQRTAFFYGKTKCSSNKKCRHFALFYVEPLFCLTTWAC